MDDASRAVTEHYSRHEDLLSRVKRALAKAGGDRAQPDYATLHRLDQFHFGGPAATREMAETAGLRGDRVLDIGCGIGGPARTLAAEYGCEVTGIDLTESYCRTARELSGWVGLSTRTRFVCASATELPFPDSTWPIAWTQHAAMNIPDKAQLYAEIARVLAPGGRLVLHDIVAGPVREAHFPVPWARTPSASFLLPGGAIHERLLAAGLQEELWHDATAGALAKIRETRAARDAGQPEEPGPHLIMGPEFATMRKNLARNLEEGRIAVIKAAFRKPRQTSNSSPSSL